MPGFTLYPNAYRQGLDDAIRAQVIKLFNVLMSDFDEDNEVALKRFTAGLSKTLQIERQMKQLMTGYGLDMEMKSGIL